MGWFIWDRNFAALKAWKAQHGGGDPPAKPLSQPGIWDMVPNQRHAQENKLLANLRSASRASGLHGVVYHPRNSGTAACPQGVEGAARGGSPKKATLRGLNLGIWCHSETKRKTQTPLS